jgi:GT2 family glycosyltransferase
VRIEGVELQALADLASVETLLRAHTESGFDVEQALRAAAELLAGRDISPAECVLLSKRMMPAGLDPSFDYPLWLSRYVTPAPADYARIAEMTAALPRRPTFSFVVPVYDTPPDLLRQCLDSLLAQTYPDFEICLADDASPNPAVPALLDEYARRDPRIRWVRRIRNGHISAASNSALALAGNEFVVLVDHDDTIPDYALFVVAWYINQHPQGRIFFSDEDKISVLGELSSPYFKSDFNKFLMYGHNMVSHLGVYERALVNQVGGFRRGLEGSQDYDLFLRCYEIAGDAGVIHIPHVLYHWRTIPGSTSVASAEKSYAIVAAEGAINGHFERTGTPLRAGPGFAPGVTGVAPTAERETSVSIIIPTRDALDVLEPCIRSIDAHPYANVELIVVDNGSVEPDTLAFLEGLRKRRDTLVIRDDAPFNYSGINNAAAAQARGEILCFLNNDTEVLAGNWIDRARGLLALPDVGIVGARLLYPDGTLQHFGIGLGMAEHRVASTPHAGLPGDYPGYFGKARMIQEFSAVTAACMFIRAKDFHSAGGFDPALRVAYNDVDLCLKVRRHGLRILCDPEILLTHKESRTRGSDREGARAQRLDAEAALMRARWSEVLDQDPYVSPNIALDRVDFALAYPPRVPMPWQEPREV